MLLNYNSFPSNSVIQLIRLPQDIESLFIKYGVSEKIFTPKLGKLFFTVKESGTGFTMKAGKFFKQLSGKLFPEEIKSIPEEAFNDSSPLKIDGDECIGGENVFD